MTPEIIPPGEGDISVAACMHPFQIQRTEREFPAGLTLAEIAHEMGVRAWHNAHTFVGDQEIPREVRHRVRPKPGARVIVRVVPTGGGGGRKNPLSTVLMVAVAVAASAASFGVAGWAAGIPGMTSAGASVLGPVGCLPETVP